MPTLTPPASTRQVIPASVFETNASHPQWLVQSTGGLRYPLYAGNVTVDDVFKVMLLCCNPHLDLAATHT